MSVYSDMVQISAQVSCVWPAHAILGEGPCWDDATRKLYWTDIKAGRLYAYSPNTGQKESWALPCRVGSVALPPPSWTAPPGMRETLLLACGDPGLMWLELTGDTTKIVVIAHPEAHLPENRFNDGKIGPDGRYWAGTMHDPEEKVTGSLYAFSADGDAMLLDSGYRVTNGPAFSPDGRIVYHTDSARQSVYAFDLLADGSLANKRVLIRYGPGEGYPDGMTADCDGNLFIAMWDGSRIEKISAHGTLLGHIGMPTPRITSCTFAGDSSKILYATSASVGLESDQLAGSLFEIRLA